MARVDPHLIYGCEVVLDENPNLVTELEEVQLTTLGRILQTSNCSMIAPLFSETGILPIRYRCAQLARRYLLYLLEAEPPIPRKALTESQTIAHDDKTCWLTDLWHVLRNLPVPVLFNYHADLTPEYVSTVLKNVDIAARFYVRNMIMKNTRLPLLRARLDQMGNDAPPKYYTLLFRHYLKVTDPAHKFAITRLLIGGHPFAVERLGDGDPSNS